MSGFDFTLKIRWNKSLAFHAMSYRRFGQTLKCTNFVPTHANMLKARVVNDFQHQAHQI